MKIVHNGEPRELEDGMSIARFLETLGLNPRYLAVELNQAVVPRQEHARILLRDGDHLEVVTLVGGG